MNKLTIDEACTKYGVQHKKLLGRILRNDHGDPLVVDYDDSGDPLVLDDWRLQKLDKAASKAGEAP